MRPSNEMDRRWLIIPREHGAWGLLLQPFVCAAILGKRWDWLLPVALVLILTGFILREPLVILARQRWVWRNEKPESATARRCLLWEIPLAAASLILLAKFVPAIPLVCLASAAGAITIFAVWMAVHNRQRSAALQAVSSIGLGISGLLAALVSTRGLPDWAWQLWALLTLHGVASILVVRGRLELRAGARSHHTLLRAAWAVQLAQLGVAAWLARPIGIPVALSGAMNIAELIRMRSPSALSERLTLVGLRTLAASLVHAAVVVAVLW